VARSLRRGAIDIAEGFYLGRIVHHLHRSGILERLEHPATAEDVARECGYDPEVLRALLEYVRLRTDLLARDGGDSYSLNPAYAPYRVFGFHLDKLLGAYGPPLERLDDLLRAPTLGAELVDDGALAGAFSRLDGDTAAVQSAVIRAWTVDALLDLGSGPGTLLLTLARADPSFRGWGIDANPAVCATATERIAQAGLDGAVRVVCGDVRDVATLLDSDERDRVAGLHAGSLLNELFRSGGDEAVDLVVTLGRLFPGRLLFVSDYYGKLGWTRRVSGAYAHSLLQDVAQTISGQGVPPPDRARWAAIYDAAGSALLDAYEGDHNGVAWFVHVVRL
jgi:Methyltransferase domain